MYTDTAIQFRSNFVTFLCSGRTLCLASRSASCDISSKQQTSPRACTLVWHFNSVSIWSHPFSLVCVLVYTCTAIEFGSYPCVQIGRCASPFDRLPAASPRNSKHRRRHVHLYGHSMYFLFWATQFISYLVPSFQVRRSSAPFDRLPAASTRNSKHRRGHAGAREGECARKTSGRRARERWRPVMIYV